MFNCTCNITFYMFCWILHSTLATEAVSFCCLMKSSVEQARFWASSGLTMQTDACNEQRDSNWHKTEPKCTDHSWIWKMPYVCDLRSCDGGGCMKWKPRELWAIPMSLVLFPNDNSTFYRHSQVKDGVRGAFSFFVQQTEWIQSC